MQVVSQEIGNWLKCGPNTQKGNKDNVENYRPISLTSLVMKTLKRILKDEFLLRTSHLLDSRQHGFVNQKYCTTVNPMDDAVLSISDTHTMSTNV